MERIATQVIGRGRFFCQWLCPAGTAFNLTFRFNLKKKIIKWRLNAVIFWATLDSALLGVPIFLLPLFYFLHFLGEAFRA